MSSLICSVRCLPCAERHFPEPTNEQRVIFFSHFHLGVLDHLYDLGLLLRLVCGRVDILIRRSFTLRRRGL